MGCAAVIHPAPLSIVDFLFSYCIGKGGFAKVTPAMHIPSKEWFAMKEQRIVNIVSHRNGIQLVSSELSALRRLGHHPFIAGLHFAFHDPFALYLALDLCGGGDLRYHLRKFGTFTEPRIAFIILSIASALDHIHRNGVLHRDIKPENIIFTEAGYVKITDFGVSYVSQNEALVDLAVPDAETMKKTLKCSYTSGTKQYLAPEVYTSSHEHGTESDYWSLGILAFELLFGKRPFEKHCPHHYIAYAETMGASEIPINSLEQDHLSVKTLQNGGNHVHSALAVIPTIGNLPLALECSLPSPSPCSATALVSPLSLPFQSQAILLQDGRMCATLPKLLRTYVPPHLNGPGTVSLACRTVISNLLDVRPSHRHSYETLLADKWFSDCGWDWGEVERMNPANKIFPLDLKQITLDLCTRHMFQEEESTEDIPIAELNLDPEESALLTNALNRFYYVSPEYSQYCPSPVKGAGRTASGSILISGDS
jgi:serine/threonine protein kinase